MWLLVEFRKKLDVEILFIAHGICLEWYSRKRMDSISHSYSQSHKKGKKNFSLPSMAPSK